MKVEFSIDELIFIRRCLDNAPKKYTILPPAAVGLGYKIDSIILAAQCAEGQTYIGEGK